MWYTDMVYIAHIFSNTLQLYQYWGTLCPVLWFLHCEHFRFNASRRHMFESDAPFRTIRQLDGERGFTMCSLSAGAL